MAFTFRKATKAILATSSTTTAAFIATGFSKIMPISSFGYFAGILVPVNFALVCLYFPAVLMIYELKTKNFFKNGAKKICSCCFKDEEEEE